MYVYCSNNPVNFIDDDGESATAVFQTWLSGGWAVALAEPTVFGEIIYGAGIVLFGIAATIETVIVAETLANRIYDICEYRATVSATSSELAFIDSASTAATPPPPNKGGRGTRTNSTTLYNKKGIHIDVENSGNRIGQIHLQKGAQKYYYNVAEKVFRTGSSAGELAPRAIQELLKDPAVIKAIAKGLKILGY